MATETPGAGPQVIWRLLDGRRGHYTQIEGLSRALAEQTPVEWHDLAIDRRAGYLPDWLLGRFPPGERLPRPALILAAGHATHFAALAARRAYGGHIVVLMQPSLPLSWFDLCLVPEHDDPPQRENVISTRGAITTVRPSEQHDPATGLILLGGPSRHYAWDTQAILEQVRQIVATQPQIRFRIGDSPRTPAETREAMGHIGGIGLIPWEQTQPGDIQQAMAEAGQVWVSEDSVSMLYEAVSSGAPTGLLAVPRRRDTRISRGVDRLAADKVVTTFAQWSTDGRLQPATGLDEALRCAREILQRWPPNS
jgi:mitochondrial fission protein ELM1